MKPTNLTEPFDLISYKQLVSGLAAAEFYSDNKKINYTSETIIEATNIGHLFDNRFQNILVIKHKAGISARVKLAVDTFKLMSENNIDKALVAFVSPSTQEWRLSYVSISLNESKGRIKKTFSNPKRYSYVLGPNAKTVTPYQYLIQKGRTANIEELQKRFSVEVVNNEFYKEIAKLYDELVGTEKIARKLNYPSSGDESHEFAVRLIGRVIFCWFLREKKSKAGLSLIPSEVLSRQASGQSNYYHSALAPLFFEVLNKPVPKRTAKFQTGVYKDIPYLNGGLFNDDSIDHYKFDKGLELSVPGLVDVPDSWLHELFDLLERFNFTVDENTSYDTDLSIDPEMLGRVFENLLARINPETGETVRKSTGSFYTPREIVEYMVDASLSEYLVSKTGVNREKIDALISYDLFDDIENELNIEEGISVLEALSTLTVLDPACGSGAFPIGMLQKIVFIITNLDPNADWWLAKQLEGASPEIRREFTNRSVDYVRKLGIIRQTIFGVDIQPIATEISRLRCFLTLIVDEAIDDTQENRGIRPLPNLDFKFVTANSLITLPKPEDKKGVVSETQAAMFEETSHIDELKKIRNEYFSSTNHERNELQSQFMRLQKKMVLTNVDVFRGSASKLYDTLSRWDPFEHNPSIWFDPEWMFGISGGFDIVIANPPYIHTRTKSFDRSNIEILKKLFKLAIGQFDYFALFTEKAAELLKDKGVYSFIIPTRVLSNQNHQPVRDFYLTKMGIISYLDAKMPFETASVEANVLVAQKNTENKTVQIYSIEPQGNITKNRRVNIDDVSKLPFNSFGFDMTEKEIKLLWKISQRTNSLGSLFDINRGYEFGLNHKAISSNSQHTPLIKSEDIHKFWLSSSELFIDLKQINKNQVKNVFDAPKLITKFVSNDLTFALDEKGYHNTNTVYNLHRLNNSTDFYLVLGLLNSQLLSFWFRKSFLNNDALFPHIQKNQLEMVPLRLYLSDLTKKISSLAEEAQKENNSDVLENIEHLVYTLYGLTPEEIQIVESSTK